MPSMTKKQRVRAAIMGEPVLSIGGGARGVNIHLTPAALVAALGASVVDVTQPEAG